MSRPWMPSLFVHDLPPNQGPTRMFGYDGKLHPERPTPSEWRAFRLSVARKKGTHSQAQWNALKSGVNGCAICGDKEAELTKDHIFPIMFGGCDCIENIQAVCASCNSSKGARV